MRTLLKIEKALWGLKRGASIEFEGRLYRPAIVVTGASEGLGRAFARLLAMENTVIMVARHADQLEAAAEEIKAEAPGADVKTCALDVTREDAPALLRRFLEGHGLYADILINNAGTGLGGRFDAQDREEVLQIIDLNVRSLVALTHELLPGMRRRGTGGILNLASLAGFMPGPWQALYFASKSFVLSYSQAIASENAGAGVHIMAAAPGPIETAIHDSMKARWTWYRFLFPSYTADSCAAAIWEGFRSGQRVFVPGVINNLSALAAKLLPHDLLVPLIAWLVRPRFRNGRVID